MFSRDHVEELEDLGAVPLTHVGLPRCEERGRLLDATALEEVVAVLHLGDDEDRPERGHAVEERMDLARRQERVVGAVEAREDCEAARPKRLVLHLQVA